ncbi:hypothetical protein MCAP1_002726 [Malassezia caprae]|uniref:Uncharacterized protein n=1 Tax=Malassezia caprae TaxID=1381934 RepID=A0AAF0IX12_9BASI|nr:hypothetical protein MCAP1_002726 [Malassezia caprae]
MGTRLVWAGTLLVLLGWALGVHAQGASTKPTPFPSISTPSASMNGQSACVQFGDCTKGHNTYKTETYGSAITSPSSRKIATLKNGSASSSYISSVAAAGASQASGSNPASSTPVPPPTSVQFDTKTMTSDNVVMTSTVMPDNAAVGAAHASMWALVAMLVTGGAMAL